MGQCPETLLSLPFFVLMRLGSANLFRNSRCSELLSHLPSPHYLDFEAAIKEISKGSGGTFSIGKLTDTMMHVKVGTKG